MELLSNNPLKITRVQFYSLSPTTKHSLIDIENVVVERLKILKCIERISYEHIKGSQKYNLNMGIELAKCSELGKSFVNYTSNESRKSLLADIERDILSHYMLMMAYFSTLELRKWFIQQEVDLFSYRFKLEQKYNSNFVKKFLEENKIQIETVSVEERKMLMEMDFKIENDSTVIYKSHVDNVLDLIIKNQVFLVEGYAFLLESDVHSIVVCYFRSNLSHSLSCLSATSSELGEEDRLMPMLSSLHKRYIGKDFSVAQNGEKITASQIKGLSQKSFPPCMQRIQLSLERDHHLKHGARMQYGLFLKGIGMSLEESLKFWRNSFQGKTDLDTFAKKYAYSIRHNYGQEGKRVNYTPYSCRKIITTNLPQAGDCHGCPLQSTDPKLIEQNLKSFAKATAEQIESVMDKIRKKQYEISCRNYFKIAHGLPDDFPLTITHPNQYFEESQKITNS